MTQGEAQELFAELEARWVLWVLNHPGWKLRHGEGRILQLGPDPKNNPGRLAKEVATGKRVRVKDLVHLDGGVHYLGTGADWQLFVDGHWITDSDHPAWVAAGEHWEQMHPDCRWGGRFTRRDGNHISVTFNGMA